MASVTLATTFDRHAQTSHGTGYLDQWVTLACFFGCARLLVIDDDRSGVVERWYERLGIPARDGVELIEVECFVSDVSAMDKYLDAAWVYVEQPRKLEEKKVLDAHELTSYSHESIRDVVYAFGPDGPGFDVRVGDPRRFLTVPAPNKFPGLWSIQAASMVLYARMDDAY